MYLAIVTLKATVTVETIQEFFKKFPTVDYRLNGIKISEGGYLKLALEGVRKDVDAVIKEMGSDVLEVEQLS